MNKFRNLTIATGLVSAALIAPACGESGVEQEAYIQGFGYGINSNVIEAQWHQYTDQVGFPIGEVRGVNSSLEVVDCREVYDGFFNTQSDSECMFDLWCSDTGDTHCEAVYEPRYSFQRLEDTVVRQCIAPIMKREFKPDIPIRDTVCEDSRTGAQRLSESARYLLYVSTPNPDKEVDGNIKGSAELSADEWQRVDWATPVIAVVDDGRIVDIKV